MNAELSLSYSPDAPYDPVATLSMLGMLPGDPCFRIDGPGKVRLAIPAPSGPLSVEVHRDGGGVQVKVVGVDPDWLAPFLPALLGLDYRAPKLEGPARLRTLAHQFAGLRLPRAASLFPRIVQIVLQQLVSYRDAGHGWRTLVRRHGEPTPGSDESLLAPPTPETLARLAEHEYIECGILPQHGRRVAGLARVARRIEQTWQGGTAPDAVGRTCRLLAAQRGIGPWTIGNLRGTSLGDDDAIVPGDYGFPKRVSYFFTGSERLATDDDMLGLLEPYRPHRFYVLSLLLRSPRPPRRGPRRRRLRDRMQPPRR